MPALIFLNRKWLIASDDFVILSVIDAVIRIIWCVFTGILIFLRIAECHESSLNIFLYVLGSHLFISFILSVIISSISAKGSVLEIEKRRWLACVLYAKLLSVGFDTVIACAGTWICTQLDGSCIYKDIFIKVSTAISWTYVLVILIGISVCYDSLGSSKYWNFEDRSNSLNFFKKAQYIWRARLKLFCCCADISEENDFIYVEISTFLSSFLNGIDLVPTDILAGIISVSQKHALLRRNNVSFLTSSGNNILENTPVPPWMTAENASYFLKVAKSTYGWLAFFEVLKPWKLCLLSSHARCCLCCCPPPPSHHLDNCCSLNLAAIQKKTGLSPSDIFYASFRNTVHEPAFYASVDHPRQCVIIAIRGTMSFSDLMTDLDAENGCFPASDEGQRAFKCHRGTLKSAAAIQKILADCSVLEKAFMDNPSYTLVLTGHSLGGSVAAVLSLMLRPKYPNLQCYAYGPLASLSCDGVPGTLSCVMSVVVDVDLSPRLCATSCKELRPQIMEALRENRRPKYKILSNASWYHIQKYFKCEVRKPVCHQTYDNVICEDGDSVDNAFPNGEALQEEDTKLYAPGRILYFERKNWQQPYWITGLNLQNIIVHPDMIADHKPRRIQRMLDLFVKCSSNRESRVTIQET